jgi:alpha-1,3-rhamnosyl/mannosyltransferase
VTVIHLAVEDIFRKPVSRDFIRTVCSRHGVEPGRYLASVGNVSERKNLSSLVRAFAEVPDASLQLLLCGNAFGHEGVVQGEIERLRLGERVRLTGFVADSDLIGLLAGAIAIVQPSLDEGFGLPPLEAMALGTPVIASRAGSHPEIVADAGILVDPLDVGGWADAICHVLDDEELRDRMIVAGRERSVHFTWEQTAAQTLAVYRSALG